MSCVSFLRASCCLERGVGEGLLRFGEVVGERGCAEICAVGGQGAMEGEVRHVTDDVTARALRSKPRERFRSSISSPIRSRRVSRTSTEDRLLIAQTATRALKKAAHHRRRCQAWLSRLRHRDECGIRAQRSSLFAASRALTSRGRRRWCHAALGL